MTVAQSHLRSCPRRVPAPRAAALNGGWRCAAALVVVGLLVGCALAHAQAPRFNGVRVNLWATPRVVPADGKSAATIRAELRDAGGGLVADGTTVVFRIEGGSLNLGGDERRQVVTTTTVAGGATVYATGSQVGTATVYAELTTGEGKNRVVVAFVEEGSALLGGAGVVHVRGGWVGYALDLGLVEARDGAEVEFGAVRISSEDILQVDVNSLRLIAKPATIEVGDNSLHADEMSYDLMTGEGALRRLGDAGVEQFCFNCYSLAPEEPEAEIDADRMRLNRSEAAAWAVGSGVSIHPHEKVVLRDATLYAGGQRVLDLPKYWIIAMPGYTGSTHTGVVGMNSSGELAVDFPYFYSVTETQTGAIKLQHGAASSSVIARDDWSLALQQEYDDGAAEGVLSLVGLPHDDWGLEWRDRRALAANRDAHVSFYSPDHQSYYGDASVYQWTGDRRLNLTATVQDPDGGGLSYAMGADLLSMNQPLGTWNATYRVGTAGGLRHIEGLDDGLVAEHQVYGAIDLPRTHIGERTSVTPTVSDLFTWDTSGYRHNSLRGELSLRHIVSSDKSIRLGYQGQLTSGDGPEGYDHLVNLDLRAYHGRNVSGYLSGSYDIGDDDLYAFGLVDYYFSDKWRLALAATYYDFGAGSYDDIEVTVARELGLTEVGLRWSEATGRISVEFGEFAGLGL